MVADLMKISQRLQDFILSQQRQSNNVFLGLSSLYSTYNTCKWWKRLFIQAEFEIYKLKFCWATHAIVTCLNKDLVSVLTSQVYSCVGLHYLSIRRTPGAGPEGVRFRESWLLYTVANGVASYIAKVTFGITQVPAVLGSTLFTL